MWTISLPLKIQVTKKKERYFALNLNQYRNTNPFTLDKAKDNFDELVQPLIRVQKIPVLDRCTLEYVLYPGTRQLCDTNNICCIVDKFFSDSLVSSGALKDDNYNFIVDTRYRFGSIDRERPRVDVIIRDADHPSTVPWEPFIESDAMKIQTKKTTLVTFTQDDLEAALKTYLADQLQVGPKAQVVITPKGTSYEIRIEEDVEGEVPATTTPATKAKKPRLEPAEAMAALHSKAAPEAPQTTQEPTLPATEEKGHSEPIEPQFENGKAQTTAAVPETSVQETEQQPETEETPAPAPKKASLFGGFTRPKN